MFKFWKSKKDNEVEKNESIEEVDIEEDELDKNEETQNEKELNQEFDQGLQSKEESEEVLEKDIEEISAVEVMDDEDAENSNDEDVADSDSENLDENSDEAEIINEKKGIFSRLLEGLTKTKSNFTGRIDKILKSYTKIDEELLEELEEVLITADVGLNTTMDIIDRLRDMIKERGLKDPLEVRNLLREIIESILKERENKIDTDTLPLIIVMVGVNGVGKTTTIGKLAKRYKTDGKKVLLAAADTFRAAASEQLDIWSKRVGVDIVKHSEGADPGAVVFDAIKAAKSRNTEILIVDTAGRLHNKTNLMNELGKIFKIISREYPEAKREVILVVDATTGQNAVSQAKTFKEVADITGIALTKLDGTAKGGVVLAVKSEVDVPVKLIGVGEKAEDLQDFDPESFSKALFD